MRLKSVLVKNFKGISEVSFDLEDVTLLIGGNNSGKSSILQALHFAVNCLRAARINGKRESQPASTLGLNQFIYVPTNEIMRLRHGIPMTQYNGPIFVFSYETKNGTRHDFQLSLYRGKNANVQLLFNQPNTFYRNASANSPFSIFVPGLAGISLLEERRANSIVTSGLAQGDANLYLRNVLLRLCQDSEKLARLHRILQPMFPNLKVDVGFDEDSNQFISANLTVGGHNTPLELAGTGALQALQVAAYVTLYEPKLLLLDEPDAHLHPGNQKQLVDLIFQISGETNTQVIMASHSRHVLDRVLSNPLGQVQWLKSGKIQQIGDADLSLLMDIGALDAFEELSKNRVKKLVFCEDSNTNKLKAFIESSDLNLDDVHIVPFDGVDNLSAAKTVVEFFLTLGPNRKAVVYRDGDCMTEDEKSWLKDKAASALPTGSSLYISRFTDIEHSFCEPKHIAHVANITEKEAQEIVDYCINADQARLAVKATQKRSDLKIKSQRGNTDFSSTEKLLTNGVPFDLALGSLLMPKILRELEKRGHAVQKLSVASPYIADFDFAALLD
jgi:energy-coupling factor transporter ATP-binding protein EcfA2